MIFTLLYTSKSLSSVRWSCHLAQLPLSFPYLDINNSIAIFNLPQNGKQFVSKTNDEVNLFKFLVIFSEKEVNSNCNLSLKPVMSLLCHDVNVPWVFINWAFAWRGFTVESQSDHYMGVTEKAKMISLWSVCQIDSLE